MANKLSLRDDAILNCVFNPSLPPDQAFNEESTQELKDIEELPVDLLEKIKVRELDAIKKAEAKDYDGALEILNEEISKTPSKPSLYNNRAQVYQFLAKLEDAEKDLSLAIELAGDKQKKTLCQAYCQRGLIYRKMEKVDEARSDFNKAARMGSTFARSQLVEINPYSALCNQMLRKVMEELK